MHTAARQLRQVLGKFATGVTIVTTVDAAGRWWGLTANSFSSVSLDPPLILWSLSNGSPSLAAFRQAEHFAVNILAEAQAPLSTRFATPLADKFAGVEVRTGLGGVPVLDGCSALLECSRHECFPGGDHTVFLGRVQRFSATAASPLVFQEGAYRSVVPIPAPQARSLAA